MTLTPARYMELADRMEQRAAELDEFPFDAYRDTAKLLREAVLPLRALAEEGERPKQAPEWVMPALLKHVQELGCRCEKPLLGYSPGYGPRCRLCNVDAEDQQKQEKARADALQQLIFAKDDALLAAHARVRELEGELQHERHEKETVADAASAHAKWTRERITHLEGALRDLARDPVVSGMSARIRDHAKELGYPDPLAAVRAVLTPEGGEG
jgi:hypothetical protein